MLTSFVLPWLIPGAIFFVRERKEIARRKHLELEEGRELTAPVFWQRTRNAKKAAAVVYAVILFFLQLVLQPVLRNPVAAFPVTIFLMFVAMLGYEWTLKLAVKAQEAGKFDDQKTREEANKNYRGKPQPLVPQREHGWSELQTAEQLGLVQGAEMEPAPKDGRE